MKRIPLKYKYIQEGVMRGLMLLCSLAVLAVVVSIVATIFLKGIRCLSWEMITQVPGKNWNVENDGGFLNAIAGSLMIVLPAMLLASLVSIPVVFYLNLYLRRSHPLAYVARLTYDILYGIPSIVYGAFAFALMVLVGMRASVLGGILVTTLLMVPMMVRSCDEIARSVSEDLVDSLRSLGATRWETMKVVLRMTIPGMVTAALLALGKAIGDAAAVMFTAGFSDTVPASLSDPAATLPLAIFNWVTMPEPFPERCYAAALVLTFIVLVLSLGGRALGRRITRHNV